MLDFSDIIQHVGKLYYSCPNCLASVRVAVEFVWPIGLRSSHCLCSRVNPPLAANTHQNSPRNQIKNSDLKISSNFQIKNLDVENTIWLVFVLRGFLFSHRKIAILKGSMADHTRIEQHQLWPHRTSSGQTYCRIATIPWSLWDYSSDWESFPLLFPSSCVFTKPGHRLGIKITRIKISPPFINNSLILLYFLQHDLKSRLRIPHVSLLMLVLRRLKSHMFLTIHQYPSRRIPPLPFKQTFYFCLVA